VARDKDADNRIETVTPSAGCWHTGMSSETLDKYKVKFLLAVHTVEDEDSFANVGLLVKCSYGTCRSKEEVVED
jgi:hypothetical protein